MNPGEAPMIIQARTRQSTVSIVPVFMFTCARTFSSHLQHCLLSARLSAFFFPSRHLVPCLILFSPTDLFPLSVSFPNVIFAAFPSLLLLPNPSSSPLPPSSSPPSALSLASPSRSFSFPTPPFPNVFFPPFSPLSLFLTVFSPPSSPPRSSRILFCPLPTVFFPHLLLPPHIFPFPTVFFSSVSPPLRSTGSCGVGFSSHLPLPKASPTLLSTRSLPFSTFPPIPTAASSRRSLFSPPPPSPHGLRPAYYPQPFSSSPHTAFFPFLTTFSQQRLSAAVSSHPLLLYPSSSFPASYSPPSSSPPHRSLPVSISPPSRSSYFLPRFSLPALSSPLFLSPPSSPLSSSCPLPSPRSPTAFHQEALHACARLCPCTQKVMGTYTDLQGRRPWDKGGRVWSYAAYSHGMPRTAGNHQKLRRRFYLKASQRNQSYSHLPSEFLAS
ncbi:uncharacterized protein [Symphalangus syndactylus]|uniref:uncharacterized protein n=1 Tax=Symphalangus syndactylus TaxID=9590 RepID=UPI00300570DA